MTVQEYMEKHNVSRRTVYRWIEDGKIDARKVKGVWQIVSESVSDPPNLDAKENDCEKNMAQSDLISQLQSENEYLRKRLEQAQETIDAQSLEREEAQERSDTITMQLTSQLENRNRMLEDLRERSLWVRVRTALGFAPA